MATSHTTKKRYSSPRELKERAEKQAVVEVMTEVMTGLLDHWSREELNRLSFSNTMVCVQTGANTYRIGRYDLKRDGLNWHVEMVNGSAIHNFFNKQAAVFYCLFSTRNKYQRAQEILLEDRHLSHLQGELDIYYQQLKTAIERKDEWKQDLYMARLSWCKPQLDHHRTNLQKLISSAKYSKVWENKT